MELCSVVIPVHDSPSFNGAAAGDNNPVVLHRTSDQHISSAADQSNTTSTSLLSSSIADESQPDAGSTSGAATSTVTNIIVDGPGRRAKALKSLKESIPHKMKMQSLQNSDRLYQKNGSWHKKSVRRLSKELYVIVSLYALLQSALFAAVAQTNIFKCVDWWGPIGIAIMVTLGTFKCAMDKLGRIGEEQQEVRLFQARQNAVYDNIEFLKLHGSACNLDTLEPDSQAVPLKDPAHLSVTSTRGHLVLGFLIGFSALIIFSCFRMLCDSPCVCSAH